MTTSVRGAQRSARRASARGTVRSRIVTGSLVRGGSLWVGRRGLGPRLLPADLVTGGPAVGDGEQPGEQRDRQQHEEYLVPAALMGEHRGDHRAARARSEEHTSELQSLMRISYAVFCLKKKRTTDHRTSASSHTSKH